MQEKSKQYEPSVQKNTKNMTKKKKVPNVAVLVVALVAVLGFGVLMAGGMSGWFDDGRASIDTEYYVENPEYIDLSVDGYNDLVEDKKSFVIFVDQSGCHTAEKIRDNLREYMEEKGLNVYHMMFADLKETSLYNYVRYYPSVVVVERGVPLVWLRADVDDDAEAYNNYEALAGWLNQHI
ncbi:hypothetical protein IJG04_02070 [Candidatus Saccharibacteria bacterium]|nr:hypothetical protein [Candidatus Saccharibacteria bacterium]